MGKGTVANPRPLIKAVSSYRGKHVSAVLRAVEKAILKEVKRMEDTVGEGRWPMALGKGRRTRRKPLQGVSKYLMMDRSNNRLIVRGKKTGKRSRADFLWAHHQAKGSSRMDIQPKNARSLYVPITRRAEEVTAKEAYRQSSRFGGPLKEGTIIEGQMYYYDPNTPVEWKKKERLKQGWPDFLWLPQVRLPRRALFHRQKIRGIIQRAAKKALIENAPRAHKSKFKMKITVY